MLIWLALSAATMLTALAALVLTALARLLLSALSGVLRLLARLLLSTALLPGLLLATLLMLRIIGVLRHGCLHQSPAPETYLAFKFGRPAAVMWRPHCPQSCNIKSYTLL